ncbi:hypothetical protein PRK78_006447 [Emydomyces testavorans]|uniref:Histone H4 n=1 Tax=Emydomyces testavorans TaxID=2070801 RepID=A0AAF0INM1_9EURO|nr:hypothetical protein PRK78_006447 [Emydomyces testavorans]
MEIPFRSQKFLAKTAGFMPRRHRKPDRDNIMGITRPAIRRLARRGGVKRMQKAIYETTRDVVLDRLRLIIRQLVDVLESADTNGKGRKTVTTRDVVYVLQRLGSPIYGFGTTMSLR